MKQLLPGMKRASGWSGRVLLRRTGRQTRGANELHLGHCECHWKQEVREHLALEIRPGPSGFPAVRWLGRHLSVQGMPVQTPGQGAEIPHTAGAKKPKH